MHSPERLRKATCSCRHVELLLAGEPRHVYACACLECQRCTGSAFAYRAIYPDTAITGTKGETKSWRRTGSSGKWLEQHFCSHCGTVVFMRAEGMANALSVSAGCLEEPGFPAPQRLYWPARKHHWLRLDGVPDAVPSSGK